MQPGAGHAAAPLEPQHDQPARHHDHEQQQQNQVEQQQQQDGARIGRRDQHAGDGEIGRQPREQRGKQQHERQRALEADAPCPVG